MTNEANFRLCGNVNSQNCRYWTTENPRDTHQKTSHSEKFIVWCGVASFVVIGPWLFEDEAGMAVTVNSARHSEMLRIFLKLVLQRLGVETQTLWFPQDRATKHSESPIRDVSIPRVLTNREYLMACKIESVR
jgi:hypothetical protein